MATNLKRRTRARAGIELDASIEEFFLTGNVPYERRDTPGYDLMCSRFFDDGEEIRRAWAQHRGFLLKKWKAEKRKGKPWILGGSRAEYYQAPKKITPGGGR